MLLLLVAASAFLCYGALAWGWRFATEHREVTADGVEAWAAGACDPGPTRAPARGRAGSGVA